MPRVKANEVPLAPIYGVAEVVEYPQVRYMGTFFETTHRTKGRQKAIHRPVLMDGEHEHYRRPPPLLGEHAKKVLRGIGLDAQRIRKLIETGVICAASRSAAGIRARAVWSAHFINLNPAVERRKLWQSDDSAAIRRASQFTQMELLRSCLNRLETRARYGLPAAR